jgi:hypothetical protein
MIEIYLLGNLTNLQRILASYQQRVDGTIESFGCVESALEKLDTGGFYSNKLDVLEDFDISINKSIADIRNPESRSSDFTRTITLPGTATNNRIFNFIFDVANDITGSGQFNLDFDPNKKADCMVLHDGVAQITGFLRLTEIVINDGRIEYNCTIHGEAANLFTDLENAKLNELDFSEYNHTCNIINIKDSWDNKIQVNGSDVSFAYGNGYVWTQVLPKRTILNADVNEWKADDHTPALYAKTIVDKIFAEKGYKYTADSFFTSDRFKRLIIPFGNVGLEASGATDRLFQAQSSGQTFTSGTTDFTISFTNDSASGNFDNGNNYATGTSEFTVPRGGQYQFFFRPNATFTPAAPLLNLVVAYWEIELFVNGQSISLYYLPSNAPNDTSWAFSETVSFQRNLQSGDVVKLVGQKVSYIDNGIHTFIPYGTLSISSDSYFYNGVKSQGIIYNETVDFGFFFGDKNTQKDFLLSIVKLFNLYIEQTDAKTLRFVTRDDFYNGVNKDWSKLLDYDQPHQIMPMGELQNNPYIFTYTEGSDYGSKRHKQNTGRVYGDRILRIDNDFVKSEKKVEVAFASTTLYNKDNKFFSLASDDAGKHTDDLRILYYNGLRQVPTYFFYDETKPSNPNIQFYPVSLHIDNPYDMQFDLSFGMPPSSYVPLGFNYSNQNLVNVYYYKTIAEIIDKNSKIFKGYFRITPKEFSNITFNSLYFFEGQYWRLNKVIDFNPTQEGLTQCEFLLAAYYAPSKSNTKPIGVGGQDFDNPVNPDFFTLDGEPQIKNSKNTSGGLNTGDNYGSSDDAVVMGVNNTNQGKYNTIFAGDAVSILGFDNVTTINCTDFEVPQGNRAYVENYPVVGAWLGSGKIVTITNANSPYLPTYDDWLILCNTTGGNITVTLPTPTAANKGKVYVVKKTTASHTVTINAGDGSILIDDDTSHNSNQKNGYDQLVSDGTQYWILSEGH